MILKRSRKPKGWAAMVQEFHEATEQPVFPLNGPKRTRKVAVMQLNLLHQEVAELVKAESHADVAGAIHELVDIIYTAIGTGITYGADMDKAFEEIHKANMAKRFPDGKFKTDRHGKIVKPPKWKPARIAKVLKIKENK